MGFVALLGNFLIYFVLPAAVLLYWWINKRFSYWKDRNIPGPEPVWRKLAGNIEGVGSEIHFTSKLNEIYKEFKDKSPVVGIFMSISPSIVITDPELAKIVLVRG